MGGTGFLSKEAEIASLNKKRRDDAASLESQSWNYSKNIERITQRREQKLPP